jgi:pSer/pThr/pTyr-binding forkhead associated (FHA) protein
MCGLRTIRASYPSIGAGFTATFPTFRPSCLRASVTRMKLVFPGGEHPQVLLGPGINRVGSDPQANIVLDRPGVLPQHCELHVTAGGVMLQVPHGTTVTVNGRAVDGLIALRPGDSVSFDRIQARLASLDAAAPIARHGAVLPAPANDDPGATAVRPVLPKFVLRGVSGEGFGRIYPLLGPTVVGRAPECNLRLDESGLSRQHARLVPTNDGIQIEDLGSTNGSFINGKRVQRGLATPGDEVGFDTLRFRLAAPGQQADQPHVERPASRRAISPWLWVGLAAAGLAAIWIAALLR